MLSCLFGSLFYVLGGLVVVVVPPVFMSFSIFVSVIYYLCMRLLFAKTVVVCLW